MNPKKSLRIPSKLGIAAAGVGLWYTTSLCYTIRACEPQQGSCLSKVDKALQALEHMKDTSEVQEITDAFQFRCGRR